MRGSGRLIVVRLEGSRGKFEGAAREVEGIWGTGGKFRECRGDVEGSLGMLRGR